MAYLLNMKRMIEQLAQKWFPGNHFQEYDGYSLSLFVVSRKKRRITGRVTACMRVLVCLHGNEINFPSMVQEVLKDPELVRERVHRIDCSWIVLSDHGGIYLHEALSLKENLRNSGMRNRFLVINSEDGSFSFGPGHILNREYTEMMQDLLSRIKTIPPAVLSRIFESVMECSLADLEK